MRTTCLPKSSGRFQVDLLPCLLLARDHQLEKSAGTDHQFFELSECLPSVVFSLWWKF